MIDKRTHIGLGGVKLGTNRNANVWSQFLGDLWHALNKVDFNFDQRALIQVIIVHIVPGFKSPVEFSGVRITIKSRKGPKRIQVEAAIPDIPFPEDNPEEAKK